MTEQKTKAAAEPPLDCRVGRRIRRDRDWRDYPIGTKAHAYNGGAWLKTERGWTWNGHTRFPGSTFPTPGADAFGVCIPARADGF